MKHKANSMWTLKIESYGQTFYITDMVYEDIARAAMEGIKKLPKTTVKLFFAGRAKPTE